jgi:hypothetical protein
MTFV